MAPPNKDFEVIAPEWALSLEKTIFDTQQAALVLQHTMAWWNYKTAVQFHNSEVHRLEMEAWKAARIINSQNPAQFAALPLPFPRLDLPLVPPRPMAGATINPLTPFVAPNIVVPDAHPFFPASKSALSCLGDLSYQLQDFVFPGAVQSRVQRRSYNVSGGVPKGSRVYLQHFNSTYNSLNREVPLGLPGQILRKEGFCRMGGKERTNPGQSENGANKEVGRPDANSDNKFRFWPQALLKILTNLHSISGLYLSDAVDDAKRDLVFHYDVYYAPESSSTPSPPSTNQLNAQSGGSPQKVDFLARHKNTGSGPMKNQLAEYFRLTSMSQQAPGHYLVGPSADFD
ncbi:hypothetical protein B0H13DRAFT_1853525 [Mycena leptocephala]|nr:hypothetical protein B0H13DRAFT_1853525 [Mycena leptocephala]